MDRRLTLGPQPPCKYSGGSRGGARGEGPALPHFWTKMRPEGPKKNFFGGRAPPYLRVCLLI